MWAIKPAFLVKWSSNLEHLHRNTLKILTRKTVSCGSSDTLGYWKGIWASIDWKCPTFLMGFGFMVSYSGLAGIKMMRIAILYSYIKRLPRPKLISLMRGIIFHLYSTTRKIQIIHLMWKVHIITVIALYLLYIHLCQDIRKEKVHPFLLLYVSSMNSCTDGGTPPGHTQCL